MHSVKRFIRVYPKEGIHPLGIIELPYFELRELQQLFETGVDDPMYDCFLITSQETNYFEDKYGTSFDLDNYEYFLEAVSL